MITNVVFERIFRVRYNDDTATAFAIDLDGRQYLVSARHLFEGVQNGDELEIFQAGDWASFTVNIVAVPEEGGADVIILAADRLLVGPNAVPLELRSDGVMLGQDVHFLGFPFYYGTNAPGYNDDRPLALVKKACVSGIDGENDRMFWLLDGFNIPGFSGGPVVYRRHNETADDPLKIMAIVTSYHEDELKAYRDGQATALVVFANSGIVRAYDSNIVRRLIHNNPAGFLIN